MTEGELDKLTIEQRKQIPPREMHYIGMTTRDEAREILELEGWSFVALDHRWQHEPEYDPLTDETEVWTRTVGGVTEWCEICCLGPYDPEDSIPVDQTWVRITSQVDPRLIKY